MNDKKVLGAVIRAQREKIELSQAQLAEKIGKSIGTVGQYERGEIYPTYEALAKIIEVFDADANIFFSRKNTEYSSESLLLLNMISQMKDYEKKTILKFFQNYTSLLNLMIATQKENNDEEEMT